MNSDDKFPSAPHLWREQIRRLLAAQCAMVSLEMLQAIFNARFELLGVNEAMIELRAGL
ncbi:MAG TPA: hypothetical protein VN890_03495 [Methylocella sp.]|jgi:hypothetical protein|nr:hypothetical protein [Methylocella sp.]